MTHCIHELLYSALYNSGELFIVIQRPDYPSACSLQDRCTSLDLQSKLIHQVCLWSSSQPYKIMNASYFSEDQVIHSEITAVA